jgi:acyl transferase domain-containing protein
VPSLHSEILNKNIDFSTTPFIVQKNVSAWKSDRPYLAAVSSFGAGGSYAHVILEKYGKTREINLPYKLPALKKYWIKEGP